MDVPKTVVTLLALLAVAAPLPSSAQNDSGTSAAGASGGSRMNLPSKVLLPGSAPVSGAVTTDRANYRDGRPVRITFTVTNTGKRPLVYDFPDGKRYDFTIADPAGKAVWTWSAGRHFSQALGNVTIAPGKSYVAHVVWNGLDSHNKPVAPGSYTVSAHMTSNNPPVVTGGVLVNPDSDPDNMGMATNSPAQTGAIRDVDVYSQVKASATFVIVPAAG